MKKIITLLVTVLCLLTLAGCGEEKNENVVKVAATSVPHAEILEVCKEIMREKGFELEVTEYADYVQPVEVVESGDYDANYFAHVPYLNNFNEEKGTHMSVVEEIHYEPFGVYPGKKSSLSDLTAGDSIAIPNDGTNETRALLLLQDNGIIELPAGVKASDALTVNDIVKYNVEGLEIIEIDAPSISKMIPDCALVILNGNYALEAGLNVSKDAIAYELSTSSAAETYVNVVAVKEGNESNPGIVALCEALRSEKVQQFIKDTYDGAVVFFEK